VLAVVGVEFILGRAGEVRMLIERLMVFKFMTFDPTFGCLV
jgi:hypothetical protein